MPSTSLKKCIVEGALTCNIVWQSYEPLFPNGHLHQLLDIQILQTRVIPTFLSSYSAKELHHLAEQVTILQTHRASQYAPSSAKHVWLRLESIIWQSWWALTSKAGKMQEELYRDVPTRTATEPMRSVKARWNVWWLQKLRLCESSLIAQDRNG